MEGLFDFFSELSCSFLQIGLNSIVLGTAIAFVAWMLLRLAKRLNAATRYSIWWVTLGLVFVLPLVNAPLKDAFGSAPDRRAVVAAPEIVATAAVSPGGEVVDPTSEEPAEEIGAVGAGSLFEPMLPAEWNGPDFVATGDEPTPSLFVGLVPLGLFGIWLAVSMFLLMRLTNGLFKLARLKAASRPLSAGAQSSIDRISLSMNLKRPVAVRLSDEVGYPVAAGLGKPMILLPRMLVENLSRSELESIVLHEFAHFARRDDWARLVQKISEGLFFFHPALYWIGRQLDLERELACDDQVLSRTGTPADYCRCLTRLLQLAGPHRLSLAAGALSGRRQIFSRFERLLARKAGQSVRLSRPWFTVSVGVIVATLCLCVFAMPVLALPLKAMTFEHLAGPVDASDEVPPCDEPVCEVSPCDEPRCDEPPCDEPPCDEPPCDEPVIVCPDDCPDDVADCPDDVAEPDQMVVPPELADSLTALPEGRIVDWSERIYNLPISFTLRSTDGKARVAVLWCLGEENLRVVRRGEVTFTPDDRSVASVAPLGFLAISDRRHDERIELEVRAGIEAKPVFSLFKNGVAHPIGTAERRWIADVMLTLIRDCGFGAEERVARILGAGGHGAALAEIAAIDSDRVRAEYIGALVRRTDLAGDEMGATIRLIGTALDGNDSKCALLIALKPRLIDEPELLSSFAEAFETMEKDYLARQVLASLGTDPAAGEEILLPVLALSAHLAECGRIKLLLELAPLCAATPALREAFIERSDTVERRSDRETLRAALDAAKKRIAF